MLDNAPDDRDSSDAHLPWESIGSAGDSSGATQLTQAQADQRQLPLTPWADPGTAADSSEQDESAADPPVEEPAPLVLAGASSDADRSEHVSHDPPPLRGGGWTLPLLCVGLALIACCVLIPQADANRRLVYERQTLQRDLQNVKHQIAVNEEFLKKVADDPTLAQRLAERQMKVIPQGDRVLELAQQSDGMSPFQLLSIAPPAPLAPYKPLGGTLSNLCYGVHSRLYLIGIALGMIATGLVLGGTPQDA